MFICEIILLISICINFKFGLQKHIVKTDCYEKLAAGHKLVDTDIYKTTKVSTLDKCKELCSQDDIRCLALSYGEEICELSPNIIHETIDLLPIGTIVNLNYDLHIKKTECKVIKVIDDNDVDNNNNQSYMNQLDDCYGSTDLKIKESNTERSSYNLITVSVAVRPNIGSLNDFGSICFQKLFDNRRASEQFVRLVTFCDNFEDCESRCLNENDFYCFGFNFKRINSKFGNKCELVDVPISKIVEDDHHACVYDIQFDYYERNRNNSINCDHNKQDHSYNQHSIDYKKYKFDDFSDDHFYNNHYQKYSPLPISYHDTENQYHRQNVEKYSNIIESPKFYNEFNNGRISDNSFGSLKNNNDCSVRLKTGVRLYKTIVNKYITAKSLLDCEQFCYTENHFICRTYSYRYSVNSHDPTDNCYLSDKSFKTINIFMEIESSQEYDTYAMNNREQCSNSEETYEQASDCFLSFKKGHRLDPNIVMKNIKVKALAQCEFECLSSTDFTCRGFSFSDTDLSSSNCQLTNNKWLDYLVPANNYNVYKRDSFGHGCEQDKFLNIPTDMLQQKQSYDKICYDMYSKPSSIKPKSTKIISENIHDDFECCDQCTKFRERGILNCLSFSYSPKSGICRFSDLPVNELIMEDCLDDEYEEIDHNYHNQQYNKLHLWNSLSRQCNLIDNMNNMNNYELTSFEHSDEYYEHDSENLQKITVSGYKCKKHTKCQLNSIGKFWFCEIDSSHEKHAWDYCCSPDHKCGYSNDYDYLWCYVGQNKTQWRTCSSTESPTVSYLHKEHPMKTSPEIHTSASTLMFTSITLPILANITTAIPIINSTLSSTEVETKSI